MVMYRVLWFCMGMYGDVKGIWYCIGMYGVV